MSAYVKSLNRELVEAAAEELTKPDLKQRFLDWFDSVPQISRNRPYSMLELERALDMPGRVLGPILISFGWTRHRQWRGLGPYNRYWVPLQNSG